MRTSIFLCIALVCLTKAGWAQAGKAKADEEAVKIMHQAFGGVETRKSYAMYFESIAMQVVKPLDVFTLPAYQVHKGGYVMIENNKFEINIGIMKALSDGKLMVMVNEPTHTMVIDSVRRSDNEAGRLALVSRMLEDRLKGGNLEYLGKETVHGKNCHKIMAAFEDAAKSHVIYWVEVATGKLYVMAERQDSAYTVYVIRKISAALEGHKYEIKALPKKQIEEMKGYEVMDMRFINKNVKKF